MPNADFIEIIWNMITGSGLLISLMNLRERWGDRRASQFSLPALKLVGQRKYMQELLRVATLTLLFSSGIISFFRAAPPDPYSFSRLVLLGLFTTAALLLTVDSILDTDLDHRLREIDKKENSNRGV